MANRWHGGTVLQDGCPNLLCTQFARASQNLAIIPTFSMASVQPAIAAGPWRPTAKVVAIWWVVGWSKPPQGCFSDVLGGFSPWRLAPYICYTLTSNFQAKIISFKVQGATATPWQCPDTPMHHKLVHWGVDIINLWKNCHMTTLGASIAGPK